MPSEPALAIALVVNQGAFSVNLGDTTVSNMPVEIPPSIFTNADIRLRIWFNDGIEGFQQFYPDQRLTSVSYAFMAANVADAAITSTKLSDNSITSAKLVFYSFKMWNPDNQALTMTQKPLGTTFSGSLGRGS